MHTICIAAQKGGAGKTTLARNIAVAAAQDGQRVLCLDLDPQQSLRQWWQAREGDMPMMLNTDPAPHALKGTIEAAKQQFDVIVIDTPPAAPAWLADTLAVADLALIPVRPSPDDLRAVGATISALYRTHPLCLRDVTDAKSEAHRGSSAGSGTAWQGGTGEYCPAGYLC